jgi:hypothetical protein
MRLSIVSAVPACLMVPNHPQPLFQRCSDGLVGVHVQPRGLNRKLGPDLRPDDNDLFPHDLHERVYYPPKPV